MSDRKPIEKPDLGKVHCSICGTTDYECLGCHLWHFHQVHSPRTHTKIPNQCNLADKTPEHLETICSRRVWIERAHHAEKLLKSHTKIWLDWFSPDPVDSTVKETLTVGDLEREDFLEDASTWVPPLHEPLDNPSKCEHGPLPSAGFSEPKSDIPTYVCDECGERVFGCMGCHLRDVHGIHSTFSHNLSNECYDKLGEYTRAPVHEDCMFKHPLVSPAYFLRSDQQMGCEGGIIIETSGHWQVVTRLEDGEVAAFGWYDTPWQALDLCYAKSESRNHDPIKLVSIKELAEKGKPNCSEMAKLCEMGIRWNPSAAAIGWMTTNCELR